jgi:hypothetical protein
VLDALTDCRARWMPVSSAGDAEKAFESGRETLGVAVKDAGLSGWGFAQQGCWSSQGNAAGSWLTKTGGTNGECTPGQQE